MIGVYYTHIWKWKSKVYDYPQGESMLMNVKNNFVKVKEESGFSATTSFVQHDSFATWHEPQI